MHDDKTKEKLLKEIAKFGNAYLSCLKVGVDKSTYYRWKKNNKKFRKKAEEAEKIGRENICDIAEHALLQNIKDKKMDAIKYALGHNSKIYKRKNTDYTFSYKKEMPQVPEEKTLENFLAENDENNYEYGLRLKKRFTMFGGTIPNKPDGSSIEIEELPNYEMYIEDWQRHQRDIKERAKFNNNTTDTADSKSCPDNLEVKTQENHKTSDTSHSNSSNHHNPQDSNT